MKVVRAEVSPFRLPFRAPLRTAKGSPPERRGSLLRLFDEDGRCGVGEASPADWIGGDSTTSADASLGEIAAFAAGARDEDLRERFLSARALEDPAIRRAAAAALDVALLDLAAQSAAAPIAHSFSAKPAATLEISALLDGDSPDALARAAEETTRQGFSTLKLKVGAGSIEEDLARLRAVRRGAGPKAILRLDANGGWTLDDARRFLTAAASCEPAFVEEPLRDGGPRNLAALRRMTGARLAVDESLDDATALDAHADAAGAEIVVLKIARLGGITRAVEIGRRAIALGFTVVVTDSIETSIGMAAALHLAASLASAPQAVGLGGCQRLGGDVVRVGDRITAAPRLALPGPGLGVRFEARSDND